MVLHSGFRLDMMYRSENGFVFAERFKKSARFEKVFKDHKVRDGGTCLKEGQ